MAPDIFLSYSREDAARAKLFAQALDAEGFEVWWDVHLRSGEAYDEVTEQALKSAKAVIVLWSPTSVASRWVRAEATQADRRHTLLPATIAPCERPVMFELTQTADLGHWRGDTADSAWKRFVGDVRRLAGGEGAGGPLPSRAAIPEATPRRASPGEAPLLAVLPFRNRSSVAEDEIFAFGMVEDITEALATCADLRVVASTVTVRFAGPAGVDIDALVSQLGVRYFLEGNVRRAAETLLVTAQAIDASSGAIMWSQRFERPLERLAELQQDLVQDVARRLRVQTERFEIERILRKPADLTAWECVMRVIACGRDLNPASLMQAIAAGRSGVAAAPDYALAQAFSAMSDSTFYNFAVDDDPAEVKRMRVAAEKALALDSGHPQVIYAVSNTFSNIGLPHDALRAAERGVQSHPLFYLVHNAAGRAYAMLDRSDEAVAHFDRERELAPGHVLQWISDLWRAIAEVRAGRWERADAAYDACLAGHPDQLGPNIGKAVTALHLGHLEESQEAWERVQRIDPEAWEGYHVRPYRRAFHGNPVGEVFFAHIAELRGAAS